MKLGAGVGLGIALAAATAAHGQTLGGLHLGDPEIAAAAAVGPGVEPKPIKGRPGAASYLGDSLSVIVCHGQVSGMRITRPGDFMTYAALVEAEASRQGFGQTMITHGSSVQEMALAGTNWSWAGVKTRYELIAVGKPGAAIEMIAIEYASDPDPCPKGE